jgi:hypothetical protein
MFCLSNDSFRFPYLAFFMRQGFPIHAYADKISTLFNKQRNGLTDDLGEIAVVPFSFTSDLPTMDVGGLEEMNGSGWTRDV